MTVPESGDAGTRLFATIDRALADIPRSRFAGTIAITDGEVHDIPEQAPGGAPLNVLIPADADAGDGHADHHAGVGDEHDLVALGHRGYLEAEHEYLGQQHDGYRDQDVRGDQPS